MATGEREEGAAALRRALGLARERENLQDVAVAAVNLSDALHQTGSTEEALDVARAAHAQLGSLPTRQGWIALAIAQQSFDAGDWEAADVALAEVERRHPAGGNAELETQLRQAELALGRDERRRARALLARAAELAVDSREPQYLGVLGALQTELAARECDTSAPAPRSTTRSTGSSSAPTTRCAWRWSRPPALPLRRPPRTRPVTRATSPPSRPRSGMRSC